MATIREIAQEAAVSVGTVSNVLNAPTLVSAGTRERVLAVIRAHNYRPSAIARSLATGRTRTVGLIVSNILNPFTGGLVQGAGEAARDLGCSLLVASAAYDGSDVPDQVDALVRQWVDGIFVASQPLRDETYDHLDFGETPVVIMDYGQPLLDGVVGLVGFDWKGAGYQATHHLVELGHRRIGYVGGIPSRSSTLLREAGYRQALAEVDIPYDPTLHLSGDYLTESGFRCALELLQRSDRPSALAMGNDVMALGAYQAAAQLGMKIPDDVSIVGIDDNFFVAYVAPALTTVHIPTRELGRLGLEMLYARSETGANPQHAILPTSLVVRGSTAPLARGNWIWERKEVVVSDVYAQGASTDVR